MPAIVVDNKLIGEIKTFSYDAVPSNYLKCEGEVVSRTIYATLWNTVQSEWKWGNGDGSTTFKLPDLRGRFLRGYDSRTAAQGNNDPDAATRTDASGAVIGNVIGSYQDSLVAEHSHDTQGSYDNVGNIYDGTRAYRALYANNTDPIDNTSNCIKPNLTPSGIGGSETRPINANVVFCIKWQEDSLIDTTPIGSIIMYSVPISHPNYVECGDPISRSTYSTFWNSVLTTWKWGNGDGSTTFNVPDMRGRFARGWDHGKNNDPDAATRTTLTEQPITPTGDIVGSYQENINAEHGHDLGKNTDTRYMMSYRDDQTPNNFLTLTERYGQYVYGFNTPLVQGQTVAARDAGVYDTSKNSMLPTLTPPGGKENRPKNASIGFYMRVQ